MNLEMALCEDFNHHLGSTGHTLQLAIKAGLDIPEVAKAIDAARQVVGHFHKSAVASCSVKKCQTQLKLRNKKLQIDCPIHWNSVFAVLERLDKQRITVQAVLEDESVTKPKPACTQTLGKGINNHVRGNACRALVHLPRHFQPCERKAGS